MSLNEVKANIKARVWKAIAQAELDVSSLDKETLESLVDLVAEVAMLESDDELDKSLALNKGDTAVSTDILDDAKEDILWEGRPFLSISLHYTVTDERIRITEGFLGKARENVELIRVQDVDYGQTFSERILNLGDINIRSHDSSHPLITLKNIKDPNKVYEILRRAVLHARKKHNFTYREEM
ncbi:MAG: PH domain-containing protein [Chloroflexi bacterium]|nr:PH domain-containing protein [Chloroflexota bacterium]